jgi:hypothetical protein
MAIPSGVVTSGLVAYYDAADTSSYSGSGTTWTNIAAGGGFNATLTAPSVSGGAMVFNGTSTRAAIARPVQDDLTLSCWFKTSQSATFTTVGGRVFWGGIGLIGVDMPGFVADYLLSLYNGIPVFGCFGSVAADSTDNATSYANNRWHHVVATRVKATGTITLFINGVQTSTKTGGSTASLTAATTIYLGTNSGTGGYFSGSLGPVAIYSKALTAAEVNANYAATGYPFGVIAPAPAAITVSGGTPSLVGGGTTTNITPDAATIAVTGTAPTLVTTTVLTPAAAAVTVTGTAPKLENTVSPPGGSLTGALITITGTAPTLTMSLVTTGATITITGGTPSTAGEAILTPAAATVTVTGTAPTLLLSVVPGSETLPLTGGTPVLIAVTVLSPAAAPISVTGGTPVVILPITLQPSSASITVTGSNPTITVGIVIASTPDEDHLLLVRREKRSLSIEGSRTHLMGRFKQVVDA